MGYALGVDLGTTFTAAAIRTNGHPEIAQLGSRRAEIPSLVFLRPDGAILIGEAAERRGATEPARLAREFKRRVGDPVPVLVGGAPYPAHALMARLLREVLGRVTTQQQSPPDVITVTHPANWGPYKRELLEHAVQLAELDDVHLRSEPEAAAVQYASTERVRVEEVVAVYDLGGGTFDAAVLRKTATGFEVLGDPAGVEQLGGVDFDEAIFAYVTGILGGHVTGLDPEDPAVIEALVRLRRECVEAKEALSYDTEVMIPVALPTVHTRVRLNRSEFEAMITPALTETVAALRRTLRSAGVAPEEIRSILLAGGSSRIPLVSQMLSVEFGRPLVLDAHPEHSIALGAALATARDAGAFVPPEWNSDTAQLPTLAHPTGLPAAPAVAAPARPPPPPSAPLPLAPPPRRRGRTALVAGAAAVVLLLGAGAGWLVWRNRSAVDAGTAGPPAPAPLGSWVRLGDLPVAVESAAVTAYQNRVWVAGGRGDDPARTKLSSVFVYDPDTGGWTRGPDLPRPTSHGALVAAPWGLYFLGGRVGDDGSDQVLRLSDDSTEWVDDVPLPEPRAAGAAAFDGDGIVYLGGTRVGGMPSNRVFRLLDDEWATIGKMGSARQRLTAVGNETDTVWALGGRNQLTNTKYGTIDRISQGKVFPSAPGVTGPISPPVDSAAGVGLDRAGVCLVGGETLGPGRAFNDWWCDKPGTAARLPGLQPQRAGLGAARIGRTVYVVGGYGTTFRATKQVEAYTLPN